MSECDQDRSFGESYAQLSFQGTDDVLRLGSLTCSEKLGNDTNLFGLTLREKSTAGLTALDKTLTEFPAVLAISSNFAKTKGTVSGFGLNNNR